MFAPEALKFMQRCLLVYSCALVALGFLLGVAFTPSSPAPRHRIAPTAAPYAPDRATLNDSRRA